MFKPKKGLGSPQGLLEFSSKQKENNSPYEYETEINYFESYPQFFNIEPKIGDTVESEEGTILKITDITHRVGGKTLITLKRNLGGTSPGGGGGSETIAMEPE